MLCSYCPSCTEIPRRFALLTPAKLRRNDIVLLLQTLKERICTQEIDEESKYKCYIIFLDSRFRGNDK